MPVLNIDNNGSFLCSWSGGKDSYLACLKALEDGAQPTVLFNVLNENGEKSRSHGIPKRVLLAQAECIGLPIEFMESTWQDYEENYIQHLQKLKAQYEFQQTVFGDIDIEKHKDWEVKVSKAAGLIPQLPLWQQSREALVFEMIEKGIKAIVVSCRANLAEFILGRVLDLELVETFRSLGIDLCGENGEYHTLVLDGPLHKHPLSIEKRQILSHESYSFLEMDVN